LRPHKKYSHDGWINLISFKCFDIKKFLFFSVDEIACNIYNKICRNRNRLKKHKLCHEGNLIEINSSNLLNDRFFLLDNEFFFLLDNEANCDECDKCFRNLKLFRYHVSRSPTPM
jgi:hypothetical protein